MTVIIVPGKTVTYGNDGTPTASSNTIQPTPMQEVRTPAVKLEVRTPAVKLAEAQAVLAEAATLPSPITPADVADILARAALALDGGA